MNLQVYHVKKQVRCRLKRWHIWLFVIGLIFLKLSYYNLWFMIFVLGLIIYWSIDMLSLEKYFSDL